MEMPSRLPVGAVGALFGGAWLLVGLFWATILHWERTGVSEARRRELEREDADAQSVSPWIRAWRLVMMTVLVGIPLLFAIDGLVYRIGIIYAPELSLSIGPELVLQLAGIVFVVAGLILLIGLGRKLAVNVYRLAVPERKLMTTGLHRYVRHPFYIHCYLLPLGSFLLSVNILALPIYIAYTMQWEPKLLSAWMREEEADLRRRYGTEADAYLARTGRVLPRLRWH
jgi:protein-S-isoprenylcysteine O-methyltransferase Ste14